MDLELTSEQQAFVARVRDLVDREVRPQAAAVDAKGRFPDALLEQTAVVGLMGVMAPASDGGAGQDAVAYVAALEELARGSAALAVTVAVNNMVCDGLLRFGSDDQKRSYVQPLATGAMLGCYALTEPEAGSDAAAIQTTAARDGDHYVLNGTKAFITSGRRAKLAIVYAVTDPDTDRHRGITAFLVERGTPGFSAGKPNDKMGLRGSETCKLQLKNVRVAAAQRLGPEGDGFRIAMALLDGGRLGIAAQSLGIGRAALDAAAAHARARRQFGKPIGAFEPVQWMLADTATELHAARLLTWRAAWLRATGKPITRAAAEAKLAASEAANRAAYRAVEVFGGYGYVKPNEAERLYRDARATTLYEGTSEIQRLVIARTLVKENG